MGGDSFGRSDAVLRSQLDQYQSDVYVLCMPICGRC